MMHKDKYKSPEYFKEYIDVQNKRIDKFKQVLSECGESDRQKLSRVISNLQIDLISAQISSNEDEEIILSSFRDYAYHLNIAGLSSYSEYVDFLSLQVILGVDDCSIAVPKEFEDDLSIVMENYICKGKKPLSNHLCFPDYYKIFLDYYLGNISFNVLIDYVQHKWFLKSAMFPWFNSHNREDDTYTGYWCFVASALIRMKNEYVRISENDRFIV